jgi:4-amino-4-deoxy-L-arabinose transferase-like glycosyltransferase
VELSAQAIEREGLHAPSWLAARPRRALIALLALALVIYSIPLGERSLWNQDEARQALLARDTLRHGLRLPVKIRDEAYLNKPPLFFWSVALVSWPAGRVSQHTAAIPSLVAALAALAGTFAIARLLSGPLAGLVALAMVGTSPGFYLHSHALLPDMALTAWLAWVLYFLLAALRDETPSRAHLIGLYGCIAGAMWIKGLPALLVVPAGAAAVLAARGRWGFAPLRPLLGFAVVALLMMPWAIPYLLTPGHDSGQSTDAGTAIAWYLDRFDRVSSIPLTGGLISFLPWALWALVLVVWWRRAPERVSYRPVVAWGAVTMFLIALAVQQRARYLLPLYPVFAVLVAAAVTGITAKTRALVRVNFGVVLGLLALILVQAARLALGRRAGHNATQLTSMLDVSREGPLLALLVLVGLLLALRALWTRGSPAAAVGWIAVAMACVLFVEGWLYPARMNEQMPIEAFAHAMRPRLEKGVPILGFPDANLAFDFYLDHPVQEVAKINVIRASLDYPVSGNLLLRQSTWHELRSHAHRSWCAMGEAGIGTRSIVMVGPCP